MKSPHRSLKTIACVTLSAILIMTIAQAAPAVDVVDQQQPTIDPSVGGLAINSGQNLAQIVTAGVSGELVEVRFPVACDDGSLILEIRGTASGSPDETILSSTTLDSSNFPAFYYPDPPSLRSLRLAASFPLTAGISYAVVLRSAGHCGVFQGPIGDTYAGGDAFYQDPAFPQWSLLSSGRNALPFQTVMTSPILTVTIDIKPGSETNSINLAAAGLVPVAIISSAAFDATTVDPASVSLAGAKVKMVGKSAQYLCSPEDVNGDGRLDLVCHVQTIQFLIEPGETLAVMEAVTLSGQAIRGEDFLRIVP